MGSYGGLDHRAALVHLGGSYTTDFPGSPKLGTAFNVGSGDDDPTDGVHGTFDQLYPLGHAYYGYMDLFALQNLLNVEVTVEASLPRRATLRVALQDFVLLSPGTDAWYNVGGAVVHEAGDATTLVRRRQRAGHHGPPPGRPGRGSRWATGASSAGAYPREADIMLDTADFFYLQTMVGF